MKEILRTAAIDAVMQGRIVYKLVEITKTTTIGEMADAEVFAVMEDTDSITGKTAEKAVLKVKAEKAVLAKPTKRGRPPKIDSGKVKALHTAGWSVSAIAFEMRADEDQVRKVLAE